MMKQFYRSAQVAFPLLVVLFLAFPQIDLQVSASLWAPDSGFWGQHLAWMGLLHQHIGKLLALCVLVALVAWGLSWVKADPFKLKKHRKSLAFLLLAIILGPGLIVNVLLKDQWGRARPGQVTEFGGINQFTPAWVVSGECAKNCSFVCGDASLGFILIAGVFVSRRPRVWVIASVLLGGLVGYVRIAQGGHFLSDVIFSWYAVIFSVWLTARWLQPGCWDRVFPQRSEGGRQGTEDRERGPHFPKPNSYLL